MGGYTLLLTFPAEFLGGAELYEAACQLREVLRGRAMLLIEDRTDIVDAAEADGVVISQRGAPLRAACLPHALLHRCLNRSYCTYNRQDDGCLKCWFTVLHGDFLPPWRRNKPSLCTTMGWATRKLAMLASAICGAHPWTAQCCRVTT